MSEAADILEREMGMPYWREEISGGRLSDLIDEARGLETQLEDLRRLLLESEERERVLRDAVKHTKWVIGHFNEPRAERITIEVGLVGMVAHAYELLRAALSRAEGRKP